MAKASLHFISYFGYGLCDLQISFTDLSLASYTTHYIYYIMTPMFPCCHLWKSVFCRRGSCTLRDRYGTIADECLIFQTQGGKYRSATQHIDNLLLCGNLEPWESLYPISVRVEDAQTLPRGFVTSTQAKL